MAEKSRLASYQKQEPATTGGYLSRVLQSAGDEALGALERYGRRSGAQRDASLALMSQAADPNTDPLTGAGMKALGLAGLVTHPLAFFPTREEWDQRLEAAGNDSRIGRSIGGFLSDLPSLIDPQMAAGGGALAAAPLAAKMLNKAGDVAELKRWSKPTIRGEEIDAYHGTGAAFDEFTIPDNRGTKGAGSGESPIGIWTTDSPQAADAFADFSARGQGANVRPVTVRFKNPLEVNDYSEIQDLVDKFTEFSRPNYVVGGRQLRMTTDKIDYEGLRKYLADQGYDGIALRQTMTDAPDVELPDGSVTRNPIGQFISLDPQSVRPRFGRK